MTDHERMLGKALKALGYANYVTELWHTAVCHEYGRGDFCMNECEVSRKALIAVGFLDAEGKTK